jgi:hypothetical protein
MSTTSPLNCLLDIRNRISGPHTPPDLLLRLSDPPPVQVRGKNLRDLLTPAYARLAADPAGDPEPE